MIRLAMIRLNDQGIHIASKEGALTMSMAFDDNSLASSRFTRALADVPIPMRIPVASDTSNKVGHWQLLRQQI